MNEGEHADGGLSVRQLLGASREARWAFPSSSGRPLGAETPPWALRLLGARDELRTAAAWLLDHGDPEAATELAANAWRLWVLARDEAEGRAFLAAVLDARGAAAPTRHRALALYGDGVLAFRLGDLDASRDRNEAALTDAWTTGAQDAEALAHLGLSRVELSRRRSVEARQRARKARELVRGLDPALDQAPLHMLAQATRACGALDEAAALFAASLALNRQLGDAGMVGVELHNLGHVELRRGRIDEAERCFTECAAPSDGTDPYGHALDRMNRAAIACARGQRAPARTLLEEARAVLTRHGVSLAADDARELAELERRLR